MVYFKGNFRKSIAELFHLGYFHYLLQEDKTGCSLEQTATKLFSSGLIHTVKATNVSNKGT
jgi:hypothetical protein